MTRWLTTFLLPAVLGAQPSVIRVIVTDTTGMRIPFAIVQLDASTRRATSDSGVTSFEMHAADSLNLVVRRIGFAPFEGWVLRSATGSEYVVRLARLAQALRAVQVRAPSENRLYRAGFYARMEEKSRIPSRSEFFTPEDLDRRNAISVTNILQGVNFIRIERTNITGGSAGFYVMNVVNGRGKCRATVLLDGNVPAGNIEDYVAEMDYRGSNAGASRPLAGSAPRPELVVSIDRIVSPESIAGLEVYASAAQAPDALRSKVKRLACPVVAIWTGPRH